MERVANRPTEQPSRPSPGNGAHRRQRSGAGFVETHGLSLMMTLELPVSPPTMVPAGSQVISSCLRERACLIADSENGRAAVQSRRRPSRLQKPFNSADS